uniref:Sodium-dependent lysophosphatidylcholine symporter 1-B-like n=1 Tax=Sinocyclocheilus grahami TaxID=75366 RepID=A0A672SKJ1_SINGR
MARGEGAEQYSNASLLQKPSPDGIKLAAKCESRSRLSVCNKLCYAIGGAPYQITGCAIGFFLQIYLLDVALLDPFYASIILFVGRAWDAITDPTVGFLVSRIFLHLILLSTPFAVLCYFLIWYVPSVEQGRIVWYLIFYCSFQTLQTCFHVPYSALTMFISTEQKERDSATAYRMTVEVLGTLIGTAVQGQIVGMANAPCISTGEELNSTDLLAASTVNITGPHASLDTINCHLFPSSHLASLFFLTETCRVRTEPMSFFQGIRMVMGHGPYAKLVMGFLFTSLAFMLLEGNFALFCSYTLGFRNDFQNILLVIMLSATLAIPFWQWFLTKFGKKTAVYIGTTSVVPFLVSVILVPSNLIVTYIVSFAAGVSVAAAFLLPWSMLPDVVDDFKVQNPESQGHEAIFYSFYVFFTKFASGVSLGVSTLSLDFAGYVTRGCTQPAEVDLTLKILVSPAPIVLIIIGLLIFISYPINEEKRQGNRKLLNEQRENEIDSETDSTELNVV